METTGPKAAGVFPPLASQAEIDSVAPRQPMTLAGRGRWSFGLPGAILVLLLVAVAARGRWI